VHTPQHPFLVTTCIHLSIANIDAKCNLLFNYSTNRDAGQSKTVRLYEESGFKCSLSSVLNSPDGPRQGQWAVSTRRPSSRTIDSFHPTALIKDNGQFPPDGPRQGPWTVSTRRPSSRTMGSFHPTALVKDNRQFPPDGPRQGQWAVSTRRPSSRTMDSFHPTALVKDNGQFPASVSGRGRDSVQPLCSPKFTRHGQWTVQGLSLLRGKEIKYSLCSAQV
jgi:hypothetical protein